ncbi:hypothetical protein E2C01_102122 [Portunus trituberculatus]|uniref:Uncharacterized protein n=1 Tax=Portunus trituberculatus TaxID=210409 RepID=A0A5B7KHQ3_PORTR|nr:hypothetical protein [Portunus trituberculatus]
MYSDAPRSRISVSVKLRLPSSKAACRGVVFLDALKNAPAPAHCKKPAMSGQLARTAITINELGKIFTEPIGIPG